MFNLPREGIYSVFGVGGGTERSLLSLEVEKGEKRLFGVRDEVI
jgi:hypothetical protein